MAELATMLSQAFLRWTKPSTDGNPEPLQGSPEETRVGRGFSLPDDGGVELSGVEEDAVEGGGEASLAKHSQNSAHGLQVC